MRLTGETTKYIMDKIPVLPDEAGIKWTLGSSVMM
jgi:hypothetical protein